MLLNINCGLQLFIPCLLISIHEDFAYLLFCLFLSSGLWLFRNQHLELIAVALHCSSSMDQGRPMCAFPHTPEHHGIRPWTQSKQDGIIFHNSFCYQPVTLPKCGPAGKYHSFLFSSNDKGEKETLGQSAFLLTSTQLKNKYTHGYVLYLCVPLNI